MRLGEFVWLNNYVQAKAKHLKAIDFTIGLIKRLQKQGKKFPIDYNVALSRLKQMRKLSQSKFRMDTLMDNIDMLKGTAGKQLLNRMEKSESKLLPRETDFQAFLKEFPNKSQQACDRQEKLFLAVIAKSLNMDPELVPDMVIKDRVVFESAYKAILPLLVQLKRDVDAAMPRNLGVVYESRIKEPNSAFPKQVREDREPFIRFRDLVGCRILTNDVRSMAAAANQAQQSFNLVQKKNYYFKKQGYNAINYVLVSNGLTFEFQLKTTINDIEANISHDLIYAKEKAIVQLSPAEKSLVAKVIDVSTQLSMRDWNNFLQTTSFVTSSPLG